MLTLQGPQSGLLHRLIPLQRLPGDLDVRRRVCRERGDGNLRDHHVADDAGHHAAAGLEAFAARTHDSEAKRHPGHVAASDRFDSVPPDSCIRRQDLDEQPACILRECKRSGFRPSDDLGRVVIHQCPNVETLAQCAIDRGWLDYLDEPPRSSLGVLNTIA